ncbi:MAG TPA: hypothetical protein ENI95_10060 [Chloroflexi bacterium]|nr:hypothetical protein [Chloroflexota bacterium]
MSVSRSENRVEVKAFAGVRPLLAGRGQKARLQTGYRHMMAQGVIENEEWGWVFVAGALLLVMISIPFMWAYAAAAPDAHFMGVLVNPIDGASYQAKMAQGAAGEWLFHLPYTPEPHRGVFLFTFYLGLGHLARLLGLPVILVFHVARLVGGMLLFVALYQFAALWTDSVVQRRITWGLAIVGGGFGWLALLAGHVSPDILILPEAFPLQAVYANPHFPWAIAIAVWMASILIRVTLDEEDRWPGLDWQTVGLALGSVALISMAPFILLPIGIGFAALCGWLWWRGRAFPRRAVQWGAVVILFSLPLALYNAWAISGANPVFHAWMSQNLTPSPPVWDYLIAFGPLLLLAAVGLWGSRDRLHAGDFFLLGWLLSAFVLLYAPLGLQRRFSMGITVPLSVYAGRGLWRVIVPRIRVRWRPLAVGAAFGLFAPTVVLAVVLPLVGTFSPEAGHYYYISQDEYDALTWLEENADPGTLVLASPDLSLFIPVYGHRVVYGHPFETLHAEERQQAVLAFYAGEDCRVVDEEGVEYIVIGPRERNLAASDGAACPVDGEPVYRSPDGEVVIYAAHAE